MPGKKRLKIQRRRDTKKIGEMYLRGETQMQIAEELKMSVSTVCRDLKTLQDDWVESSLVDYDEAKAKELAKIDQLEREYWDAWVNSREDKETDTKKAISLAAKIEDEGGEPGVIIRHEGTRREEGQTGDPRFLTGVQWCINKRCEILGLDAPHKTDLTSGGKSLADIQKWKEVEQRNFAEIALLEG